MNSGSKERGGQVFWAENSAEACRYVTELAASRGVRKVVKSKSMVAEEIHLTPALEKAGIEAVETDLGEYIVQLRHEPPYHIVTPAMHLTRKISPRSSRKSWAMWIPTTPWNSWPRLAARFAAHFFSAEMGISGANFLVADAGMIAITTNEGNGRLCTSVPRIHVAISGIEKVIPRLQDLGILWPVLATPAPASPSPATTR